MICGRYAFMFGAIIFVASLGCNRKVETPPPTRAEEPSQSTQKQTVDALAGAWKITYTNDYVRDYTTEANGRVAFPGEGRQGEITSKDGVLLLVFEGDDRLETLRLDTNGRLLIEHYNPKADFPSKKPAVSGMGIRQK